MIQTRRQVVKEQDRYGGYASRPVSGIREEDDKKQSLSFLSTSSGRIYEPKNTSFSAPSSAPVPPVDYSTYAVQERVRTNSLPVIDSYSYKSPAEGFERAVKSETARSFIEAPSQTEIEQAAAITYSTREPEIRPQEEYVRKWNTGSAAYPVRHRQTPRRTGEEIMPSIAAKPAAKKAAVKETSRQEEQQKAKAPGRNKVLLAVYIAVVVVLAAIVIGTGAAISNTTERIGALQNGYTEKVAVLEVQEAQKDLILSEAYMTGKATEQNMEYVTNEQVIEIGQRSAAATYQPRTNWFDKFCDWLSKVFGLGR